MKKIGGAVFKNAKKAGSKFDRYKHQDMDDDEDEMAIDAGNLDVQLCRSRHFVAILRVFLHFADVVDNSDEMPKLVEFTVQVPSKKKPRKSVHERLGQRKHIVESECESIHTSRLALYSQPRFKPYNISNRLNANYVNPAQIQRNKITLTALHSFATHALRNLSATDEQHGQLLADSIAGTFQALEIENGDDLQSESGSKYNMEVQEEISLLQVSISLSL